MNPKKPKIKYSEVLEQITLAELKKHARVGLAERAMIRALGDELEAMAAAAKKQQHWPEPVQKAMHEACLAIADQIKQSIAIVEHVVTVIEEA